jgi:hypothetical protein
MKYPSALQHLGESQSHKDPTDIAKSKKKRDQKDIQQPGSLVAGHPITNQPVCGLNAVVENRSNRYNVCWTL